MTSLLVTNDFPPKVGGIQSYLWELWRRLPPGSAAVLTTTQRGDADFDRRAAGDHGLQITRDRAKVLLPTPGLAARIRAVAADAGATLVVLDPALPVGLLGPHLGLPFALVLHGAEVTVPGRLPLLRPALRRVLRGAVGVVAAGGYPAAEAERAAGTRLPVRVVPCGVDAAAFRPLDPESRRTARVALGLPPGGRLVVSVSRLVPRKGMDVLVRAAAELAPGRPDLLVAIGGSGRDRTRIERLAAELGAPVRLLGRVPADALGDLYGCADVFAMLCRNRWWGLEQEGFGIVFLEAAAAGVPAVAGDSGGAAEAVVDGTTGAVVGAPGEARAVASALAGLLDDPERRASLGRAGRARAEAEFGYDHLAAQLHQALVAWAS